MPIRDEDVPRQVVEVREYEGERAIDLAATQLGSGCSESRKRQILEEWVDFFGSSPTPIRSLCFLTRTPKRLFAALPAQSQLTALQVKWGDYDDLAVLSEMTGLVSLRGLHVLDHRRGAARVAILAAPMGGTVALGAMSSTPSAVSAVACMSCHANFTPRVGGTAGPLPVGAAVHAIRCPALFVGGCNDTHLAPGEVQSLYGDIGWRP